MDKELKKIIEGAGKIKLSESEKSHIHNELLSVIQKYPPKRAGYLSNLFANFNFALTAKMAPAMLVLVLVFGLGGGVSYAAENSLPGDTLYPIKVNITEPARGLLARTPKAKAKWATHLV